MLELLTSLLITILAVSLVRRLLGIERGRWAVTLLAVLVGEACAVLVLRTAVGNIRDLPLRTAFAAWQLCWGELWNERRSPRGALATHLDTPR